MDTVDAPRLPPAQPLAKFQYCALATLAKRAKDAGVRAGIGWSAGYPGLGASHLHWLREGQIITKPVPSPNMGFVWQCTSDERDRQ
jgi:hypothetical protein